MITNKLGLAQLQTTQNGDHIRTSGNSCGGSLQTTLISIEVGNTQHHADTIPPTGLCSFSTGLKFLTGGSVM